MTSRQWRTFFETCIAVLGEGEPFAPHSRNWCSWTTFERLHWDAGYWQAGIPRLRDIGEIRLGDDGVWGQPIAYAEIAHIIVPGRFWRDPSKDDPTGAFIEQDLGSLSLALGKAGIEHRLTEYILEIKLY